ncbi:MAG TPA: CheR family methyltransferase [Gemmatimonadaceae bacterium]|jgi:chemotaxis protein methyltransferase CheR
MAQHERWDNATYDRLADILRERAGLVFQSLRRPAVETAALHVMKRVGIKTPESFVPLVAQTGAVFDDLMAEVTIGETYFFREPGHFALLRERIIPEFRKSARPDRAFRAWSAAASTGEEPYSIAILLREQHVAGDVVGTDISRARLAAARRATYRAWSFRGVPKATIERYFKASDESFTLLPELRRDVDFRYLNLAADSYPSMPSGIWGMDVIFCRNVLIYFDRDTIAHVAEKLIESIADDGWVLLGATDPPLSDYVRCEVVQTSGGLAYRKKGKGVGHWAIGAAAPPKPVASAPIALPAVPIESPKRASPPEEVAPVPERETLPKPVPASGIAPAQASSVSDPATQAAARVRELANAGRLEEAGRQCAAALDVHRESAELHYLHAVLVAQARQFAESARAARRALYLDRSMIVAHAALGTALAKSSDAAGARRAFNNALRLLSAMDPNATVPFSGGEPAGRLLEMTRMQARLVRGDAA